MQKRRGVKTLFIVVAVTLLAVAQSVMAKVGPDALSNCKDLAFSVEEDFVTRGPTPPDGSPPFSAPGRGRSGSTSRRRSESRSRR